MLRSVFRQTLKEAGYVSIKSLSKGKFLLVDQTGKREVWFANKNHASYGLKYKNTHLEFAYSVNEAGDLI
jgi:hypothetical protein